MRIVNHAYNFIVISISVGFLVLAFTFQATACEWRFLISPPSVAAFGMTPKLCKERGIRGDLLSKSPLIPL